MIIDDVNKYKNRDTVRFHMPGHKGRPLGAFFDSVLPYDVTELADTDDLYRPTEDGAVTESENFAARLYGSDITIYSVGGATLAIQTAILSAKRKHGGVFLCDRNVHMSVINAFALCDIQPIWFYGKHINELAELLDSISQKSAIAAIFITAESYNGELSDIKSIRALVGDDVTIIADNAHGSHLAFYENGVLHPLKNGADLVIDSPHKTMPAMTGCALLHSAGGYTSSELKDAMSVFGSTSPSYLLMQSLDGCLRYFDGHRGELDRLLCDVNRTKKAIKQIGWKIFGDSDMNDMFASDPFRICLKGSNVDELFCCLCENNIIPEFHDADTMVLIPSIMNASGDFERLIQVAAAVKPIIIDEPEHKISYPNIKISIRAALLGESTVKKIDECENLTAARMITPYPPGIPLITPGEIFDVNTIKELKKSGIKEASIVLENQ